MKTVEMGKDRKSQEMKKRRREGKKRPGDEKERKDQG